MKRKLVHQYGRHTGDDFEGDDDSSYIASYSVPEDMTVTQEHVCGIFQPPQQM